MVIMTTNMPDGNDDIYPFTFRFVDREEKALCCWCISKLKQAI